MLSLIDDRLAQLEAQQSVTYRGEASIYGILERMDRLLYMGVNQLTTLHRVLKIPDVNMGARKGKSANPRIRFQNIYFTDCEKNMNIVTLKDCYYKHTCTPKDIEMCRKEGYVMSLQKVKDVTINPDITDHGDIHFTADFEESQPSMK